MRHIEGLFSETVPFAGSLIAAALLFAMVVGAVVYGWLAAEPPRAAAEREPLKKAA